MLADADPGAERALQWLEGGEVVGVRVGVEHVVDLEPEVRYGCDQRLCGLFRDLHRERVEVEDRVDDDRVTGVGVPDQVGQGPRGGVKERSDL